MCNKECFNTMTYSDNNEDDRIAALIDENLKRVYSDIVQEELPDRFKDLLAVLKAQDADTSSGTPKGDE
ncbi:NepR family anti-sigma factor [Jannaschia faecimaris]|nr:NepR family anti-sigma factor [Jannaschia faecimaris]